MKTMFVAIATLMLLTACGPATEGGCADCEKMAREANAKHQAMKAATADDCECCKGKKHDH